jgi:acetylornithine/N-succinyldiaminopimelate aminotransferase
MTATALPTAAPTTALLPVYKRAPMELVRGAGVELFDAEGNAYLDFTSGIGVNALGYGDAGIAAAARDALDAGLVHVSNLFRSAPGERLAELLVSRSFASTVFFCNSGAEANEGAFKLARRWARGVGGAAKHEILALRGGFHGRLFATLAATDRPAYRAPFRPLAGGISIVERDLASLEGALDPATVAAVILEPVQGEGGVRVLDDAFLRELRALTRSRNVLLILDEIQCGLGRTGRLWAYEHSGIEPDLMTLAKPLAGGLPMGAVLASAEVSSQMQPGDHGSTFGGGPLVASVALHVVERLSDPTLLEHVREEGAWLAEQLASLMRPTGPVRAVRGTGLMWGVDVSVPAAEVVTRAREIGLLLCTAGDHTLRLLPPLIIAHEALVRGMELFEEALA